MAFTFFALFISICLIYFSAGIEKVLYFSVFSPGQLSSPLISFGDSFTIRW